MLTFCVPTTSSNIWTYPVHSRVMSASAAASDVVKAG